MLAFLKITHHHPTEFRLFNRFCDVIETSDNLTFVVKSTSFLKTDYFVLNTSTAHIQKKRIYGDCDAEGRQQVIKNVTQPNTYWLTRCRRLKSVISSICKFLKEYCFIFFFTVDFHVICSGGCPKILSGTNITITTCVIINIGSSQNHCY